MLVAELKPTEEILGYLRPGERVFILSCQGCVASVGAGGEKAIADLRAVFSHSGHAVTGSLLAPFACNKALVGLRLLREEPGLSQAHVLFVVACGVGVQAVAQVVDKAVYPATNTVTYGAFQGLWPGEERCQRCGQCLLGYTGGICPLTTCAKGLLHGPCGGSHEGECEVEEGRPCGWEKIYDRLSKIGRLDLLQQWRTPHDRKAQLEVPGTRRRSTLWDLERLED